jgi:hypothetical protein
MLIEPPVSEIISGTVNVNDQFSVGGLPVNKANKCPKLDSPLDQLVTSADPLILAKQLNLTVKDDQVQVLLVLVSEDTRFLKDFSITIGSQEQNKVQAFVPVDLLCDLAGSAEIVLIQVPAQVTLP